MARSCTPRSSSGTTGRSFATSSRSTGRPATTGLRSTLEPLIPAQQKKKKLDLRILAVTVEGPLAREDWVRPFNFERFFHGDVPDTAEGRRAFERDVLRRFATRAFRRPVDDRTVDRLVDIAEEFDAEPGKTPQEGMARAMVAVLASPRFLFRVEGLVPSEPGKSFPLVDEYALASRLSYFLWSTMPDAELFDLVERGSFARTYGHRSTACWPMIGLTASSRTSSANGSRPATSAAFRSTSALCLPATPARTGSCKRRWSASASSSRSATRPVWSSARRGAGGVAGAPPATAPAVQAPVQASGCQPRRRPSPRHAS